MSSIVSTLESLIDASAVCTWERLDPVLQSQITQAVKPKTQIECIVYPNSAEELAEVVACSHQNQWRILLCGSGSKLHWGGLAEGVRIVVSTAQMNRLIDHAVGDLTVTAEAGMKLTDLQAILAQQGQFLAIDPAYPSTATLGGIIATADAGALRQRYGSVRDMLIGISLVRTDGNRAKAGGRVVKNVAGYDLMKLFTGSYGTLGAIDQVTFRIYPIPAASRSIVLTGASEKIAQATATLLASGLTPTAVELLAASTVAKLELGQNMGVLIRFQSIEVSVEKQAAQMLQVAQALGLQGTEFADANETALWQRLREQMESHSNTPQITCKIGVLPAQVVEVLDKLSHLASEMTTGVIHAGSGLGTVRFPANLSATSLNQMRQLCQSQNGFLSVLEAPIALKQKIDVWGYTGNALTAMQALKKQFDPQNLFSPGRFVGGI